MHPRYPEAEAWSSKVIGAAIEVHREMGPGLLINFHEAVLKDGIVRMILKGADQ